MTVGELIAALQKYPSDELALVLLHKESPDPAFRCVQLHLQDVRVFKGWGGKACMAAIHADLQNRTIDFDEAYTPEATL